MPGLGNATLGAAPLGSTTGLAPLPSPSAGIGGQNPFEQLLTAVAQIPQARAAAQKQQLDMQEQKARLQQARTEQGKTQLALLQDRARANPALADSPIFAQAVDQAYKLMGTQPPIDTIPSPPVGRTVTNDFAGPRNPDVAAQPTSGPFAATKFIPEAGPPAPPRQQVNLAELMPPRATIADLLTKNPQFFEALTKADPGQRAALFRNMGVSPADAEALINMPISIAPAERDSAMKLLSSNLSATLQGNNTPAGFRAFVQLEMPELKRLGITDPSALLSPDMLDNMAKVPQQKYQNMVTAHIITQADADTRLAKDKAEIRRAIAQAGNQDAQAGLAKERTAMLPIETQSRVQERLTRASNAAQNLHMRFSEFHQRSQGSSLSQFNASRSALASQATNLRGQISELQGTVRSLMNGPSADDPATKKLIDDATAQINQLQPMLNQTTTALQQASFGKEAVIGRSLQSAVGTGGGTVLSVDGKPVSGKLPAGAIDTGYTGQPGTPYAGKKLYKAGSTFYTEDGAKVQS